MRRVRPAGTATRVPVMTTNSKQWMTLNDISTELDVPMDTIYKWRQKGEFPPSFRLPNGSIRVRRDDFEFWLLTLEVNV